MNTPQFTTPDTLVSEIFAGRTTVYFSCSYAPSASTEPVGETLARACIEEYAADKTAERRPIAEIRREAMRLYEAGLCDLFQRRDVLNGRIHVEYLAVPRRKRIALAVREMRLAAAA